MKKITLNRHPLPPALPTMAEQLGKMLRHCQESPGYAFTAANAVFLLHQMIALAERLEILEKRT